jgi:hypothetical protein
MGGVSVNGSDKQLIEVLFYFPVKAWSLERIEGRYYKEGLWFCW